MSKLSLATQIPGQVMIRIASKLSFTIENFSVQMMRASEILTTFAGNIGSRDGVPQYSFTFEMPPLRLLGFEVPFAILETRNDWEYLFGTQYVVLVGAQVNSDDLSFAMQQGNTRCNFRGNALKRLPHSWR